MSVLRSLRAFLKYFLAGFPFLSCINIENSPRQPTPKERHKSARKRALVGHDLQEETTLILKHPDLVKYVQYCMISRVNNVQKCLSHNVSNKLDEWIFSQRICPIFEISLSVRAYFKCLALIVALNTASEHVGTKNLKFCLETEA